MDRAVGAEFGVSVNSDRTAVTDDHPWTDLSIRMQIDESHD
jgi:hypothetical protein